MPDTPVAGPLSVQQETFAERHGTIADRARLNVSLRIDITGDLHPPTLRSAISAFARRHHALRTRFVRRDGNFVQEVVPAEIELVSHDLAAADLDQWCRRLATTPFHLDNAPLIRFTLARVTATHWTLVIVQHHLITDAIATGILLDELTSLYTSSRTGQDATLPTPLMQPIDFARWQRDYLAGPDAALSLDYWRAELDGADFTLPLPGDRPRPATLSGEGDNQELIAEPALTARLDELANDLGATLYSVLLTAYGKLLAELTGRDDMTIIGTYAGRLSQEVESMVGLVSNSVPLRLRLDRDATIGEAIRRTAGMLFGHADHQEIPFSLLLDELRIRQRTGATSFPQSMFVLNPDDNVPREMAGLGTRVRPIILGGARTDLTVVVVARADGLRVWAEWSSDILDPATVRGWLRRYVGLLRSAIADTDRLVGYWR